MSIGLTDAAHRYGSPDHRFARCTYSAGSTAIVASAKGLRIIARFALLTAGLIVALGWQAKAREPTCGGETTCVVAGGSYRIELPKSGPVKGVYVFFHGYQSSADLQMGDRRLVDTALRHGLAFAAPNGEGGTWSHDNAPAAYRDEIAFVGRVLDDLEGQFGFGPDKVILGGFSQGASMAWYSTCHLGDRAAASVTFSGVFWDPLPSASDCEASPPPMIHFHGTADRTFPLAGRAIGPFHQGDTFKSVAIERERGICARVGTVRETIAGLDCEVTPACERGPIALCIHDGGHSVDEGRLDAALTKLGF